MKTVYLHIGSAKAASTSIQQILHGNADVLREAGYTVMGGDMTPWEPPMSGGKDYYYNILDNDIEGAGAEIAADISRAEGDKIIISNEHFASPRVAMSFDHMRGQFDFKILYMLRRQDDVIYSYWAEWMHKTGQSLSESIDNCIEDHRPNFPNCHHAWSQIAPVHLEHLSFLPEGGLNEVVKNWLGLDDELPYEPPRGMNPALDARIMSLLARNPEIYNEAKTDRKIHNALLRSATSPFEKRYGMNKHDSSRVMQHFHDDNVKLLGEEKADIILDAETKREPYVEDREAELEYAVAVIYESFGRTVGHTAWLDKRVGDIEAQLGIKVDVPLADKER